MRLQLAMGGAYAFFAIVITTSVAASLPPVPASVARGDDANLTYLEATPARWSELAARGPAGDAAWDKAVVSGGHLWAGMRSDDRMASFFFRTDPHVPDPLIQSVQSPYDGDLKDEIKKWGYNENDDVNAKIDKECDFDAYHHLKRAFDDLGIKTASKANSGPNQCFEINHYDGPNVIRDEEGKLPGMADQKYKDESCGKEYRITGATFQFGLNAESGMVTLMNVMSAAYSAQHIWGRKADLNELPRIRSTADMAWALWNRVSASNVKNIQKLMVSMIINDETRSIIRQAHGTLDPKRSEVAVWPGFDFTIHTPAGQAILGSPVGRWAGYFLMAHKNQLGGNKFISKVRVFKPDQGSFPYMLFYVDGPAPSAPGTITPVDHAPHPAHKVTMRQDSDVWGVGKRSDDGRNVLREHFLRVKR